MAAINDLSGFGRASLTVAIPILSSMEVQACPIPTAVLSTHTTGFKDYCMVDMTDFMRDCVSHWTSLGLSFDAVYSGFLGSAKQMDIVSDFVAAIKRNDTLVVIDPVMGDDGKTYGPITDDMVTRMRSFVGIADLITPNITEAAFLLDEPYSKKIDEQTVIDWLPRLSDMGPGVVVVTSVPSPKDSGRPSDRTSVLAYDRNDDRVWKVACDYIPAHYPGTGDAFASVLVGSILKGDSLPLALDRAVQFTTLAIRATFGYKMPTRDGIMLERVLDTLRSPVVMSSYELVR
ncbi:MAG: pyridoxamine kinase [Methanomicrobium sp.]|nr:pyridoxamine kinase [Methanomicrobium sp.]MBO4522098.1 pyridoxamine kinase [Methanomicrobium sp.]MBR6011081.1 pyridoxamine kinase [Methanomicrobium sp.]MBR6497807.1 pyridoxamine kinase [Methanomicrobium sp.]